MDNTLEETIIFKNIIDREIFNNQELKRLIQFKLNKINFTREDLKLIDSITLKGKNINGDINIVDLNVIDYFPNLKKIEFQDLKISSQYMKKLYKVEEISFKQCQVEDINYLQDIKKLSVNNSKITNLEQIENLENLENLEFINIRLEDFNILKKLKSLNTLKLKNMIDFSLDNIDFPLPIKYFSIEDIDNLDEIRLIKNYSKLETLSIDKEKQAIWKDKLAFLKNKGIKILLNDIYEY